MIFRQEGQQLVFLRTQIQRLRIDENLAGGGIDFQTAAVARGSAGFSFQAPEQGVDSGRQYFGTEGFGDIFVGAQLEGE